MYVSLLVHGAPRLRPDLFAVVQESMRNGRRDRREREAVGYSEDCREEERAVRLVLLLVERVVGVQNPCPLVGAAYALADALQS